MSQHINNLSFRATKLFEHRLATAETRPKQRSFYGELALLVLIMQCIQVNYYSMYFLATIIGGNIFLNSVFVGVGEVMAGLISGYMLIKFKDSNCFFIFNMISGLSIFLFYLMPAGLPQYLCFMTYVFGIACQFNSIFVMIELRIPAENTGAAIVIITAVGTLTASVAPYIAQAPHPFPMFVTIALCIINIGLTCCLSEPGAFLPDAVKLSANVTLLRLENVSHVINDSIMNSIPGFNTSFQRTHFEIENNVERTRLNETNMDPDMLKEFGDGTKNDDQTYSMLKHWDWELNTSARGRHHKEVESITLKYSEPNHLSPILEYP